MTDSPPRSGRRRDPRIEPAVLLGAMKVYATSGWRSFSIQAVAEMSGVGKPAVYRRWRNRADLLVSAFESVDFPVAGDHGSLRADLTAYADAWVTWFQTDHLPEAGTLILADSNAHPELGELYRERLMAPRVRAVRDITVRAIARGELHPDTPVTTIPEMLLGAFFIHWSFAADHGDEFRAGLPAFGRHTVETLIAGLPTPDL